MKSSNNILPALRQPGSRLSRVRDLMVAIFQKNHLPLSELEIRKSLSQKGIEVNKTTIYRALEHLKSKNLVQEVDFGEGKKRYELNSGKHHHHLVCTECKKIDEVYIPGDIEKIERKIVKQKHFKITNHALEFFGLCNNCVSN